MARAERIISVETLPPTVYRNGDRSRFADIAFRCRATGGPGQRRRVRGSRLVRPGRAAGAAGTAPAVHQARAERRRRGEIRARLPGQREWADPGAGSISSSIALATAAVRPETPSLPKARSRYVVTVASLMNKARPISALVRPRPGHGQHFGLPARQRLNRRPPQARHQPARNCWAEDHHVSALLAKLDAPTRDIAASHAARLGRSALRQDRHRHATR